ncbi:hypothetical protein DXG03_007318, partial [Asterophora parasitica]
MSATTPAAVALYEIFYGTKRLNDAELENHIEQEDDSRLKDVDENEVRLRPSLYVEAFE